LLPTDENGENVEEEENFESLWIDAFSVYERYDGPEFPQKTMDVPPELKKKIEAKPYRKMTHFNVQVRKPGHEPLRNLQLRFNIPMILNDVLDIAEHEGQGDEVALSGWSVCFFNENPYMSKVLFNVITYTDLEENESELERIKRKVIKKEHLSPLEENFNQALVVADKILNEMKYMERREQRMRHTAESTNSRVRMFSYLSVVVLAGSAWVQITYLKSYFKKKKLM